MRARGSRPYDFILTLSLKQAVDDSLIVLPSRRGAKVPDSKRKCLVGIGLSITGRSNLLGPKIHDAFARAGLVYNMMHTGKEVPTSAKPVDILHAQITYFHRRLRKKNPGITPAVVANEIAQFFRQSSKVNVNGLRKTFDEI